MKNDIISSFEEITPQKALEASSPGKLFEEVGKKTQETEWTTLYHVLHWGTLHPEENHSSVYSFHTDAFEKYSEIIEKLDASPDCKFVIDAHTDSSVTNSYYVQGDAGYTLTQIRKLPLGTFQKTP